MKPKYLLKHIRQKLSLVSPEVGGDTEDHYEHGVVDIEAIGDKRENTHRSHDLKEKKESQTSRRFTPDAGQWAFLCFSMLLIYRGVSCLFLLLVGDGRVHVDQTQEVQTQRRC